MGPSRIVILPVIFLAAPRPGRGSEGAEMKKRAIILAGAALALCASALIWFSVGAQEVRAPKSDAPASEASSTISAAGPGSPEKLKIASYNIQSFGRTKVGRTGTLTVLARIAASFDLLAIQEVGGNAATVSDATAEAVAALYVSKTNEIAGGEFYSYIRAGQFAIIYRADRLKAVAWGAYAGPEQFAYRPLAAYFQTIGAPFDFVYVDAHLRPSLAAQEMKSLKKAMAEVAALYSERDVICAGDFNADGSYYREGGAAYPADFEPPDYISVVPNDADTTVAANRYAYDRMELTSSMAEDFTGTWNVLKPGALWDLSACEGTETTAGTERALSDHYPIWAEFATGRDTD